jgi:membrane-bound lytic murein transglycosylase MltF
MSFPRRRESSIHGLPKRKKKSLAEFGIEPLLVIIKNFIEHKRIFMSCISKLGIRVHPGLKRVLVTTCFLFFGISLFIGIPSVDASSKEQQAIDTLFLQNKWKGDFDAMVKRREIRVLVVYSKTFYFLDHGRQRGITYDLFMEFEKFINKKLKSGTLQVKVIFLPVRRDELLSKLNEGYGDVAAANLTITPQRQKKVDFSNPALTGVKEVIVTSSGEKQLERADDLEGREVYVRKSSSYYESLLELNRLFEKTGRKPMKLVAADESFEDEDLLEMINAGLIKTIVMDNHKAQFWTKIFKNIQVHPDAFVRAGGEIAWAFRKDSPKLKTIVNEFFKKHKKGTLIGNMLLKRYLKDTKYVNNAVSKKELKKFESMVKLFKKYGNQYEFDYLMLGAQAYQESGLDQKKRSRAGAIGVMQILSSTAKDPNVNISDIHLLEKNIHAGAKYMRFISDRYFKNEPMDQLNKMLFSFAAYNAGPANVQKIRKRTAKMGLDPNVWFQNGEVAAARIIGRETVQYVGNIYKYYIAYSMAIKHLKEKQSVKKAGL